MSLQRAFYCDGPDCERHVKTMSDVPPTFLVLSQWGPGDLHFCGWDCVLRYAGAMEPETVIE